jgi:hypothetical protein
MKTVKPAIHEYNDMLTQRSGQNNKRNWIEKEWLADREGTNYHSDRRNSSTDLRVGSNIDRRLHIDLASIEQLAW